MESFNFWQKWLVIIGIISMGMSAILMLPAMFNAELSYISSAFWKSGVVPLEAQEFYNWVFGVYAAMGTAWALFIVFVAYSPFKRKEKWSWYCLFSCISVWFVIDTAFSLSFGFNENAINNGLLYVLLMLPLIFTKREFS